ncbi:MAG: hypothetical protein MZW92_22790 [Comamonadaceae bacterium]|nr:hypothetical protein [Comamonadaceae bacterium]
MARDDAPERCPPRIRDEAGPPERRRPVASAVRPAVRGPDARLDPARRVVAGRLLPPRLGRAQALGVRVRPTAGQLDAGPPGAADAARDDAAGARAPAARTPDTADRRAARRDRTPLRAGRRRRLADAGDAGRQRPGADAAARLRARAPAPAPGVARHHQPGRAARARRGPGGACRVRAAGARRRRRVRRRPRRAACRRLLDHRRAASHAGLHPHRRAPADIAAVARGVRFAGRLPGSSSAAVWQRLCRDSGIDAPRPARIEPCHDAAAAAVAAGIADLAFGTEAAAAGAGLGFVPLAHDHVVVALADDHLPGDPDEAALRLLREAVADAGWRQAAGALAGVEPVAADHALAPHGSVTG